MTFVFFILAVGAVAVLGALAVYASQRKGVVEARYPRLGPVQQIDGVDLHYVDHVPQGWTSGDPALVFVHGASANLRDPFTAFFPALSSRYRLVFVDRPGHGYSQRGGDEAHSPARQARLIGGLVRHLGIEKSVAVGHSWGGAVVAQMALQAPGTFAGLVFIAPATHPWPGGVNWYYDLAALPVVGAVFSHTVAPAVASLVSSKGVESVFAPEAAPDDYAQSIGLPLLFRPHSFLANARDVAWLKPELRAAAPRYSQIDQPAAVITGDADAIVYPEIHSAGLVRDLENSWRVDLPGAGHMPHHTRREAVVREIEAVVAKTFPGAGPATTAERVANPAVPDADDDRTETQNAPARL
ncbi:alpha/beta fold hydrolase [Stappia sp. ES.058]|uniref:alpha/beta fold hydrolase n=1 Tax=Stappia sp. ES.058 TaxID=1881061 RepID=UPI000B875F77|nr:alpha/beta hydrolase [Stappia sp. ES.058]